jgi:hypothetical protein
MRVSFRFVLLSTALALLVASPALARGIASTHGIVIAAPRAPVAGILSTPTGFPTFTFTTVPTLTPVTPLSATSPIVINPAIFARGGGGVGGLGFPVAAVGGSATPQIIMVNTPAPATDRALADARPTVEKGPKGVLIIRGPSIP